MECMKDEAWVGIIETMLLDDVIRALKLKKEKGG